MPELPEVEITRRNLDRWATGQVLAEVRVVDAAAIRSTASTHPRDAHPDGEAQLAALVGRVAGPPVRHGKRLGWPFGDRALLLHLGMTGGWSRDSEPPRFARLGLRFGDTWSWFRDARRFGCVVPCETADLAAWLAEGHGPDAWLAPPDGPSLAARFRTDRPIKVALLDQDRLAGVGNIHAVEALWSARLSPLRPARALDPEAWARLALAIPAQLEAAITAQAGDELVYLSEGADNPFSVYDREGLPCPRCGAAIARCVQAGRATFWCPVCQPA